MTDLLDLLNPQTLGVLLGNSDQPGLSLDNYAPKPGQFPEQQSAPPEAAGRGVDLMMHPPGQQTPAQNAGYSTFGEETPPPAEGYRNALAPPTPQVFQPAAGAGEMPNSPGTPMPTPAQGAGGGPAPGGYPPLPPSRPSEMLASQPAPAGQPMDISAPQASPSGMLPPEVSQEKGGVRRRPDGLLSALGIDLGLSAETKAGLGKGLAAVGQNWNKPGLAALAGSAGAALSGESDEENKQRELGMKEKGQQFNQTSTAFKDMLAAAAQKNNEQYRAAQATYLTARAKSVAEGKTKEDWRNTPFGAMVTADQRAEKWHEGQLKAAREQWKANFTPPAEQEKQKAELQQKRDAMRDQILSSRGIKPEAAAQMRNQGTVAPVNGKFPDHAPPFDTRKMSKDEFLNSVPVGAYYLDENGVARRRTKPSPEAQKTSDAANYDDQTAMAG
jgi:hypothetical protein